MRRRRRCGDSVAPSRGHQLFTHRKAGYSSRRLPPPARRAFREIALHDAISIEAARWMRQSGVAFLVTAIAMLLSKPLVSLILSLDMPAGHRFLAVTIGTPELLAAMVSGILIVFGHLIAVAAEIEDDNRQFV